MGKNASEMKEEEEEKGKEASKPDQKKKVPQVKHSKSDATVASTREDLRKRISRMDLKTVSFLHCEDESLEAAPPPPARPSTPDCFWED